MAHKKSVYSANPLYYIRGFTLLEMLVVLVLVGLISTLLLQGFSSVLQLRSGFIAQLEATQRGALQEYWFRSTITAIMTDYRDGEHIFKGEERQLSGLTIAALDQMTGMPSAFAWQLKYADGTTTLLYQNNKGEYWEIARWLGEQGRFRYMAVDGQWHTQWPPRLGLEPAQIPRAILLEGQRRQTPFTWIVKLTEHDYARYEVREDW
jgi:general secretion pathway protein J